MRKRLAGPVSVGLALAPLVFLSERIRAPVEGSMPLHMLVQFPLLFVAGASIALRLAAMRPELRAVSARIDAQGLFGLVVLSGVAALWMVPAALDAALMDPAIAAWKYASWWIAGAVTPHAWSRMASPLRLFLLGNLAWMLLTAGALYADAEQRLCVSYTIDEQAWTAIGLQVAGMLVVAAGIAGAMRKRRSSRGARGLDADAGRLGLDAQTTRASDGSAQRRSRSPSHTDRCARRVHAASSKQQAARGEPVGVPHRAGDFHRHQGNGARPTWCSHPDASLTCTRIP